MHTKSILMRACQRDVTEHCSQSISLIPNNEERRAVGANTDVAAYTLVRTLCERYTQTHQSCFLLHVPMTRARAYTYQQYVHVFTSTNNMCTCTHISSMRVLVAPSRLIVKQYTRSKVACAYSSAQRTMHLSSHVAHTYQNSLRACLSAMHLCISPIAYFTC